MAKKKSVTKTSQSNSERWPSAPRVAKWIAEKKKKRIRRICFFVHDDDRDRVRNYVKRVNREREATE